MTSLRHELTFEKCRYFAFYRTIDSFSTFYPDGFLINLPKKKMQVRIHQRCEWKQMHQNNQNFLKAVIAGDETWVHVFDPRRKFATSVWKNTDSPLENQKIRKAKSIINIMKIIL